MIDTRLTRMFGLIYPIVQAPMAGIAGGRLAAAVARAGGLGIIGSGNCDSDWIDAQFELTGNEAVGCGLWARRLIETPNLLYEILARRPRAIFLSYGDPRPFSKAIAKAGVPLICQVQSIQEAQEAVEAGAAVIVAQGIEAGGYGACRPMIPLLIELANFLHVKAQDTLLLAAGGIVDARGLAAIIAMGADGAVLGTRLWASEEALVHPDQLKVALEASGDENEKLEKPGPGLRKHLSATQSPNVFAGNPTLGQGVGIIRSAPPVQNILETITSRAERLIIYSRRKVIDYKNIDKNDI